MLVKHMCAMCMFVYVYVYVCCMCICMRIHMSHVYKCVCIYTTHSKPCAGKAHASQSPAIQAIIVNNKISNVCPNGLSDWGRWSCMWCDGMVYAIVWNVWCMVVMIIVYDRYVYMYGVG
ncbi:hypothetical protein EON63_14905 [archaeon]|nr:MAG: hypothetical protein EON63_14905 [archaeon]